MADELQVSGLDSGASRALVVTAAVTLLIHLASVCTEQLLQIRPARVRQDREPCPLVWANKAIQALVDQDTVDFRLKNKKDITEQLPHRTTFRCSPMC